MIDQDSLQARFERIGARLKLSDGTDRRSRVGSRARCHSTSGPTATASSSRSGGGQPTTPGSRCWTSSRPTATCCSWSASGARSPSSSAATTSGTGSSPAVPESAPVGTVPAGQGGPQAGRGPRGPGPHAGSGVEARNRRKNAAFRRQGEWFFLPVAHARRRRGPGAAERADHPGQRRQAALGSSSATGRAARPSTSAAAIRSASTRSSIRRSSPDIPEGEAVGLAGDAAQSAGLRPRPHPPRRPQDHRPSRLAPRPDEHRRPGRGECGTWPSSTERNRRVGQTP